MKLFNLENRCEGSKKLQWKLVRKHFTPLPKASSNCFHHTQQLIVWHNLIFTKDFISRQHTNNAKQLLIKKIRKDLKGGDYVTKINRVFTQICTATARTLFDIPEMSCFLYSELVPNTEKNFCLKFFGVWPMNARTLELPFSSLMIFHFKWIFRLRFITNSTIFTALSIYNYIST